MDNDSLIAEAKKRVGGFSLSEPWLTAGAVASALLTDAGSLYTGICLDLACGIGFCAEHAAIAAMLQDRQTVIKKIVAVSAERILPPCGRCRELMVQVDQRNLDCQVILDRDTSVALRHLLPTTWLEGRSQPT